MNTPRNLSKGQKTAARREKIKLFREANEEELKAIRSKIRQSRGEGVELEIVYVEPVDACIVLASPDVDTVQHYVKSLRDDDLTHEASRDFVANCTVYPNFDTVMGYMEKKPLVVSGLANKCSELGGRMEEVESEKL